jgi:ABC-type transport system involved in multi-copper enzyme maturation permease subunit
MRHIPQKILSIGGTFAIVSLITNVVTYAKTYTSSTYSTEVDPVFGLVFYLISICCFGLIYAAIPIACAVVVYRDAKKNKVEHIYLWTLITLLFNVIGLIIYFLAIRPEYIRKNS